jgi:hypothetical protein
MMRSAALALTVVLLSACTTVTPAATSTPGSTSTPAPASPSTAPTATAAPTSPATPAATAAPSGRPAAELCGSDWTTSAAICAGDIGDQFLFQCPPGGRDSGIYGTDTYTEDSFVCVAAVHAGLIGIAAGGAVTIQLTPGLGAYVASTRNGVESYAWGSWSTSFVFVGGAVAVPTDSPFGTPSPELAPLLAHVPAA